MITRSGEVLFFADTSVNIEPTAEDLVEIALGTAHIARRFDVDPTGSHAVVLQFWQCGSSHLHARFAKPWSYCGLPIPR
jgi:phosphotransacetylase